VKCTRRHLLSHSASTSASESNFQCPNWILIYAENAEASWAKTKNTNQTQTARRNIATIHASALLRLLLLPAPSDTTPSAPAPRMPANKRSNQALGYASMASKKGQKASAKSKRERRARFLPRQMC